MRLLRRSCMAILILLSLGTLGAQTAFYASNQTGMAFEEIAPFRQKDLPWSLEVNPFPGGEERILRKSTGEETKRWRLLRYPGGQAKSFETYVGGLLSSVESYRADGWLVSIDQYADGELSGRELWNVGDGRLASVRSVTASGALVYEDRYLYSTSGSLREVRRTMADGSTRSAGEDFTGSRPSGLWYDSGPIVQVERYDTTGRRVSRESWKGSDLQGSQTLTGSEDGTATEVVSDPERQVRVERVLDPEGRLKEERSLKAGKLVSRTTYSYGTDGKLKEKLVSSGGRRERVVYAYDGGGELTSETWYLDGKIEKVVTYLPPDLRTDEFIKDGHVIVRVNYVAGRKTLEEILEKDKVVRRREIR